MNKIILAGILLSIFTLSGLAMQGKEMEKSLLHYQIRKVEKDRKLKDMESLFVFYFDFFLPKQSPHGYSNPGQKSIIAANKPVAFSYNGKSLPLKTDSLGTYTLLLSPGKYKLMFFYDSTVYEVITDSIEAAGKMRTEIAVHFASSEQREIALKPVIYLYPEKETEVSVKLDVKDLSFMYPHYNNGWNCIAKPDGSIQVENKTLPYLFWEGTIDLKEEKKTCHRVSSWRERKWFRFLKTNWR